MTDRGHARSRPALEQLADVRSTLSTDLLEFFDGARASVDATPWTHPHSQQRIRATEVFVDLDVLTQTEDGGSSQSQLDGGHLSDAVAARYELPTTTKGRHRTRWSQLLRTTRHVVVKGAPGSGKSFLTRHVAASRLRSAHDDLQTRRVSLVNLPVTLWVSATALANVNHGNAIGEALVEAAVRSLELSSIGPSAGAWLKDAVLDQSALILVDAVDEVGADRHEACRQRLREAMALPGQVIVTCRTLQWERLKHELLPATAYEEAELAPLTPVHVRSMFDRLSSDESHRTQLAALLNHNTALQRTCTSPLRLIFVHLLVNDGQLSATTTYAGLYMHLTRALLEGRWRRRRPRWASNPTRVERAIASLAAIAWALLSSDPASNRFTLATWNAAAGRSARFATSKEQFLEDLADLGLLVPAGFDDVGSRCWSFAHRTLLEYLAARELASRPTDKWVTEARSHLWYEPEWIEVLTFLASLVPDATPLIIAADSETDDVFGAMLEIKARLVGVSKRAAPARVRRLVQRVWGFMLSRSFGRIDFFEYENAVRALGWHHLGPLFTTAIRFGSPDSRDFALSRLGLVASDEAVALLLHELRRDQSEAAINVIRYPTEAAMDALTRTKRAEATELLVEALQTAESYRVRWAAAGALGQLADPQSSNALVQALRADSAALVRQQAAASLGHFSERTLVQPLVDVLQTEPESEVRATACIALSRVGGREAVDPLIHLLRQDSDPTVRHAAVRALVGTDAPEVADHLLHLWSNDRDPGVRSIAGRALREVGALAMLESHAGQLIESLRHHEDPLTRRQAAASLRSLPCAFGALCDAYIEDDDAAVRREASRALPYGMSEHADRVVRKRQVTLMLKLTRDELDAASVVDVLRLFKSHPPRPAALASVPNALEAVTELLLNDQDPAVRARATEVLAAQAESHVEGALIKALKGDPDRDVRRAAARALGKLATPIAVEALVQVAHARLASENTLTNESRKAAIIALTHCRGRYRGHPIRAQAVAGIGWQTAAAVKLTEFGVQLRKRGQLNDARMLLHAALTLDREVLGWRHPRLPHRLMNLASVELLLGRLERARRLIHRAWRWQTREADLTAARIVTLRLAVAWLQKESTSLYLGQLKSILRAGSLSNLAEVHTFWTIDSVVRGLRERLRPQQLALLKTLVAVLNGSQNESSLEECEEYRLQPPAPVELPWSLRLSEVARADAGGPQGCL